MGWWSGGGPCPVTLAKTRLVRSRLTGGRVGWRAGLGPLPNYGYYMPWSRDLTGSHGTTPFTFAGTDISRPGNLRDDGGRIAPEFNGDIGFFLNNLISAQSPASLPVLKEVGAPGETPSIASALSTVLGWFNVLD